MVYCTNCGTGFEGNFCPKCGTPAAAPIGQASAPPYAAPYPPPATRSDIPANWASILCYAVPILAPIIFLNLPPYNQDAKIRFDARQAIRVQIFYCIASIALGFFRAWGWRTEAFFERLLGFAYFALLVFMAIKCYNGEKVILPYFAPRAEKGNSRAAFGPTDRRR